MLRLELISITKQYPAVKANDRVDLRVKPGEIHAVLGENGAGKSTLMKIIYGAVRPDEGEIRWNGQPVQVRNPHEARQLGISMVFQHFSLFDTLTAAENVWLGLEKTLSRLMIGAEPPQLQHVQAKLGDVVLAVHDLTLVKQDQFGMNLQGIGFDVRAGEVVGIAGVSGNGQQELMAALSGEDPRAVPG